MIKVGIIGIGDIGKFHLENLLKMKNSVLLTGISECDNETKEQRKKDFHLDEELFFSDWKMLCESENIDAVFISVPDFLHAEMTRYALNCGKHVFCEKPMAINTIDAESMLDASVKNDRLLMIGHVKRFWPEYRLMKKIIESGKYGKVESAKFRCVNRKRYSGWLSEMEKSGGVLMSLGIHDIDAALWFFGEPKITKNSGAVHANFLDVAFSLWEYDDFVMSFECSRSVGVKFSTEFSIALTDATLIHKTGKGGGLKILTETGEEAPEFKYENSLLLQSEYFINCIEKNVQPTDCLPKDSLRAVKIAEEITNSILEN